MHIGSRARTGIAICRMGGAYANAYAYRARAYENVTPRNSTLALVVSTVGSLPPRGAAESITGSRSTTANMPSAAAEAAAMSVIIAEEFPMRDAVIMITIRTPAKGVTVARTPPHARARNRTQNEDTNASSLCFWQAATTQHARIRIRILSRQNTDAPTHA